MSRIPRLLRIPVALVGGWLALFAAVNAVILLAGVGSRWAGKDPQLRSDSWPGITHLRMVDDKLLVGGQPSRQDYRDLAEHGVTTVIDVREDGVHRDDPETLEALGMEYFSLPLEDGQAPTPGRIRRFLELVDEADGRVFAHCSGGVGRSTSLAAVYEAAHDQDPSVLEQVAVGPPTIEQIWFVGTLRPGDPEHEVSPVIAGVSRVVDSPRTLYSFLSG
ncbi:MAG TPA: sulfur transferase domain-containing protein [Acidimicrobiales bacterium]|nr:sulfur transferase domain-containing protein [Acidimicrobiales bacterium]